MEQGDYFSGHGLSLDIYLFSVLWHFSSYLLLGSFVIWFSFLGNWTHLLPRWKRCNHLVAQGGGLDLRVSGLLDVQPSVLLSLTFATALRNTRCTLSLPFPDLCHVNLLVSCLLLLPIPSWHWISASPGLSQLSSIFLLPSILDLLSILTFPVPLSAIISFPIV